jgi:hypothetical protein
VSYPVLAAAHLSTIFNTYLFANELLPLRPQKFIDAAKTPVHLVVHDKTLVKFHHLHKVELVALWAGAGILPDQGVSVEVIATIAPPANELVGTPSKAFLEEPTHLVVPSTNTGVALKKHRDERAFEHTAWCVKCYQLINLTSPRVVNPNVRKRVALVRSSSPTNHTPKYPFRPRRATLRTVSKGSFTRLKRHLFCQLTGCLYEYGAVAR